ncbi:hypothetical protein ARMSODRAFT_965716 [Armillaria solidipes]|uniref:Uncharacterized protein n=1 Tax=Armillaria solidipes TaxID=1076256 RepID=A0A2H3B172_9AGAR|nr:hypothetical protein ARMSODRAFT_965716 [Armillaria solidipes]
MLDHVSSSIQSPSPSPPPLSISPARSLTPNPNLTLCHVSSNNTLLRKNFIQLCATSKYCPVSRLIRCFLPFRCRIRSSESPDEAVSNSCSLLYTNRVCSWES